MFLCAQARPRWNPETNSWWDGKLGIWPIGHKKRAERNSVNRAAGTWVWENENITQEVYRKLLIEKLLPAIQAKWPRVNQFGRIRIQQDGAKSHIHDNDEAFATAALEQGLDVRLYTQPANSPDLNLLDLGFFRAIQSFNDACPTTELQLIEAVEEAYDMYPREKINRTWLTLQTCMNEIIKIGGDNDYKIPHMNKARLERRGELPNVIPATDYAAPYLLTEMEEND